MGYNTDFSGTMTVTPPLNGHEQSYLADFTDTRHTSTDHGPLVIDRNWSFCGNTPQGGKPGIWCHWVADDDGNLDWDGSEKTYDHAEWLRWLIEHLFGPASRAYVQEHVGDDPRLDHFTHDHIVDGTVGAYGECSGDIWRIVAKANTVEVQEAKMTYLGERAERAQPDHEGICLDAESVRAELVEAPECHDLDQEQATRIAALSDEEIHLAIDKAANDKFWDQYYAVRRDAISALADRLDTTP